VGEPVTREGPGKAEPLLEDVLKSNFGLFKPLFWFSLPGPSIRRWGATRCRIVECTQVGTGSTRHVPAGPYAGVVKDDKPPDPLYLTIVPAQ
jgi:hypothetical protein